MSRRDHLIRATELLRASELVRASNDREQLQRICELAAIQFLHAGDLEMAKRCIQVLHN